MLGKKFTIEKKIISKEKNQVSCSSIGLDVLNHVRGKFINSDFDIIVENNNKKCKMSFD